jgi:hypothetical protein
MMVDQGFGGGDPRIRLTQLQEALRDCRYIVGIKLHTKRRSKTVLVSSSSRGFSSRPTLTKRAAAPTTPPTLLHLGKLEIQALRDELLAQPDATLSSSTAFVAQGGLPLPHMRQLLLHTLPIEVGSADDGRPSLLSASGANGAAT